jgi:disease resistance protein RPM1
MAETALRMATALVGSALSVASSAAREEMSLLIGVHDDIWYFLDYFLFFNKYIQVYTIPQLTNPSLRIVLSRKSISFLIEEAFY